MYKANILADSTNVQGNRIITMELTYPRIIHAEFLTHRTHSRNSASSRAIPVKKILSKILNKPFTPSHWGKNQRGMVAVEEIKHKGLAAFIWNATRYSCVMSAWMLSKLGCHKEICNRLVEPWMWITVIATANEGGWNNYFNQRCHPHAEPHIQKISYEARKKIDESQPNLLLPGEWHLPLDAEGANDPRISTGRCARVSYETHNGIRDVNKDIELHDRLTDEGHWSPFEHVAQATLEGDGGNLGIGYTQYRKMFSNEYRDARTKV